MFLPTLHRDADGGAEGFASDGPDPADAPTNFPPEPKGHGEGGREVRVPSSTSAVDQELVEQLLTRRSVQDSLQSQDEPGPGQLVA